MSFCGISWDVLITWQTRYEITAMRMMLMMMMMMMMISHPLSPGPVDSSFHEVSGCESHCRWHLCEDWPNALIVAQSKGCHVVAVCKFLLLNL